MICDSSGGGLVVSLCNQLTKTNTKLPKNIFLFSPWVDLSLDNKELEKYQKIDPFISKDIEKIWGKLWAGELDVKDERVSPYFSNLVGIDNVDVFVGTREVLYPDVVKFYNKLRQNNNNINLHIGINQNHCYPIYPIPESQKILKYIVDKIKENK